MSIYRIGYCLLIMLMSVQIEAQTAKRALTHQDLTSWNTIKQSAIANNGEYVAYQLAKELGDPSLKLYHQKTKKSYSYPRGGNGVFTADNQWFIYRLYIPQDSLRQLRRKKVKKADLPEDSVSIVNLNSFTEVKIAGVQSMKVPEKWSGYMAYHLAPQAIVEDSIAKLDSAYIAPKKETKENGSKLIIRNLSTGVQDTFFYVTDYQMAEEAAFFSFVSTGKDSLSKAGVYTYSCATRQVKAVYEGKGKFKHLTFDKKGERLAFLADTDTTEVRIRPFKLYIGQASGLDSITGNHPVISSKEWLVSEHRAPIFSDDSQKLYFGIAPPPILQDSLALEEDIAKVEVWTYKDDKLHTQQNVEKKEEEKRSYLTVYHLNSRKLVPLGSKSIPEVAIADRGVSNTVLAHTEQGYGKYLTWEGYTFKDVYLVDEQTGEAKQIAKRIQGYPSISPKGKYIYWYSRVDTAYYAYGVASKQTVKLTDNNVGVFYDELNDRPMLPYQEGVAGWLAADEALLVYDRYDLWKIDPTGENKPQRLTNGREQNLSYRYIQLDPEERFIDQKKPALLHLFDTQHKGSGYARLSWQSRQIQQLEMADMQYTARVKKAKDANALLFTKESFQVFPDLIWADGDLKKQQKVSNANPQQQDCKWGTIELASWTSLDGQELNGMLIKPEGFDPRKKYPMIVNFYERSSDRLHRHPTPSPGRSTINYAFYASQGYVIFNPDIPYKEGYPGESAYNALMPGVTMLINKGFIDKERIGLQGHSWGGYQVAYLITRTHLFRCVESGAPVVNMFSAYGGIRWRSGLSRMFQYERTQSRIGGTIWEYPLRYLENSPIFFVDKIHTPVLILHNDHDGAVPWYQGIEFFGALRRLGKPAWMLNYNDEPHWPLKLANRVDFNIRMQQYFDYYLKDAPMPQWMETGVSPLQKGIEQGYELKE